MPTIPIELDFEIHGVPCEPGRYWGAMLAWGELVAQQLASAPVDMGRVSNPPVQDDVSECALPGRMCKDIPGRGAFLTGTGGSLV